MFLLFVWPWKEDPRDLFAEMLKIRPLMVFNMCVIGNNNLSWSRSIKVALAAKVKLGFIYGNSEIPIEDSPDYEQWIHVDCMESNMEWIVLLPIFSG